MFKLWGRNYLALLLAGLAVSLALVRWRRPERSTSLVAGWLILAGVGISIVAAVSPRYALESAFGPLAAIGLFVFFGSGVLSRLGVLTGVLIAGSVIAMLTLVDFISLTLDWMNLMSVVDPNAGFLERLPVAPPRPKALPALHPNSTTPMLYISTVAGVALSRVPELRTMALSSALLTGLAVVVSGSRGGLLVAIAGILVAVYLGMRRSRIERARVRRLAGAVGIVVFAVLGALVVSGFRPSFIFRSTLGDRLPVMRVGLEMFADAPIFGHGPGAFRNLFSVYAPDLYPGVEAQLVWTNAHNSYIQALLEYGLVGTALIVLAIMLVTSTAVRSARLGDRLTKFSTAALVGALVAFGLHCFIDSLHLHLAPMSFVAAIGGAAVVPPASAVRKSRSLVVGSSLVVLLVVPVAVATTVGAHLAYLNGRVAVVSGDRVTALREFGQAAASDPLPVYTQALNYVQAQSGAGASSLATDRDLGAFAPTSISLNVAVSKLESDPVSAARDLEVLYPRIRGDEVALIEYGFMQLELDDESAASAAFTEAVEINPWLSGSPFLDVLPGLLGREVLDGVYEAGPCRVGDEFLLSDVATERQVIELSEACPVRSPARMLAAVRLGHADQIFLLAEGELESTPDSTTMRLMAGVAALESGAVIEGRRNLAIGALLGDPYSAFALSNSYSDETAPVEVRALVESLSADHSPVLIASAPEPVYLYAAVTMGTSGHREGLPSPLVAGPWQHAYTSLHEGMVRG